MTNILEQINKEIMSGKEFPEFRSGDTVAVKVRVIEEGRERLQTFEGVVIARSSTTCTVRKISYGEGVERVFQLFSPIVAEIKLLRRGKVRRAKLYYLRELRGKKARIKEKL